MVIQEYEDLLNTTPESEAEAWEQVAELLDHEKGSRYICVVIMCLYKVLPLPMRDKMLNRVAKYMASEGNPEAISGRTAYTFPENLELDMTDSDHFQSRVFACLWMALEAEDEEVEAWAREQDISEAMEADQA